MEYYLEVDKNNFVKSIRTNPDSPLRREDSDISTEVIEIPINFDRGLPSCKRFAKQKEWLKNNTKFNLIGC